MRMIVSGGFPAKDHHVQAEGFKYDRAFVQQLDWQTGDVVNLRVYRSPPELRDPSATMQLKAGTLTEDELIIPASTEILFMDPRTFQIRARLSDRSFNDLHHVAISPDGDLYIANTGLEMVQVMDRDGAIRKEYPLAEQADRFDRSIDFRFAGSTKPHAVHVNYVFFIDGEPWCTRFQQKDAVSLLDRRRCIDLGMCSGMPHDGVVVGDFVYFTITSGAVVVAHARSLRIEAVYDLNDLSGRSEQLGWCRGILVDGARVFVGFTRLRRSKFREYGSWILHGEKKLPSRVCELDLEKRQLVKEVPIGEDRGAAIFSLLAIRG